jgi:hypothetical protein
MQYIKAKKERYRVGIYEEKLTRPMDIEWFLELINVGLGLTRTQVPFI